MLKSKLSIFLLSWITSIILFLPIIHVDILEYFNMQPFDFFTKLQREDKAINNSIIVLLIDEASLEAMDPIVGRWPWPRYVHAEIISFLKEAGAEIILFDILFTEKSKYDEILSSATKEAGNVIHSMLLYKDEAYKDYEDLPVDFINKFAFKIKGLPLEKNNSYAIPVEGIYKASIGIGVVNVEPDSDGVYRRMKVFHNYKDVYFPSLFLSPLVYPYEGGELIVEENLLGIGEFQIPLNRKGEFLILNYGNIEAYSMSAVLKTMQALATGNIEHMEIDPSLFKGKIVFIGASAVGLEDLKNLPIGNLMPGVYMHVFALSNILNGEFISEFDNVIIYVFTFCFFTITALLISFVGNIYTLIFSVPTLILVIFSFSYVIFIKGFYLSPLYPSLFVILTSILSFSLRSAIEGREKRKIRKFLEQYVSPAVVAEIVDHYNDFIKAGQGKKSYISVMFSDIRNFTAISETKQPEEVVQFLNKYFATMSDIVFSNSGTLDKFIGDALMAFWGEPLHVDNPSLLAVKTAIEMQKKLEIFNHANIKNGFPALKVGIGINAGYAVVGNIGYEKKLDYTAIGDTVNTASRLENLTKSFGVNILISESVYKDVYDTILCRFVAEVFIKGKSDKLKVYEPLWYIDEISLQEIECVNMLNDACLLLYKGNKKKALALCEDILKASCDNYLKEIAKRYIILIRGGEKQC